MTSSAASPHAHWGKAITVRRVETIHLSPDEHCAVHYFIRVHGRRPAPEELAKELRTHSRRHAAAPRSVAVLTQGLRRDAARLFGRL